jgi:hypothetical protein
VEDCGLCPVFASFTLAFALQLRKKHMNEFTFLFTMAQQPQWAKAHLIIED